MTKKVKIGEEEFDLEDKDVAMILAIQELTYAIKGVKIGG